MHFYWVKAAKIAEKREKCENMAFFKNINKRVKMG